MLTITPITSILNVPLGIIVPAKWNVVRIDETDNTRKNISDVPSIAAGRTLINHLVHTDVRNGVDRYRYVIVPA